jgi:glycosyltransferase involved in cell wall biosynthesis
MNKHEIRDALRLPEDRLVVAFVGGMSYGPNREAAEIIAYRIRPKVQELGCDPLFLLIGQDPSKELSRLRSIKLTGYVDSVAPYLLAADLCIAPIYRGGGVKLKTLHCMAAGKPVIATHKAVEGTATEPWVHYIPAETPEEIAEIIAKACKDMDLFKAIGRSGYEYVHKYHSVEQVTNIFI